MLETIQRQCTALHHARIISCLGLAKHAAAQFLRRASFHHAIDRDEAESVAFYALTRAAMAYDPDRGIAFSTYALRAMQHELWKSLRKSRRGEAFTFSEDSIPDLADDRPCPAEQAETKDMIARLKKAVRSLPKRSRRILEMHYEEDMSLSEAGKKHGLSRQRTAVLAKAAREHLRNRIII